MHGGMLIGVDEVCFKSDGHQVMVYGAFNGCVYLCGFRDAEIVGETLNAIFLYYAIFLYNHVNIFFKSSA